MGEENLPPTLLPWRDLSLRAALPLLPPSAREVSPERSRALRSVLAEHWLQASSWSPSGQEGCPAPARLNPTPASTPLLLDLGNGASKLRRERDT